MDTGYDIEAELTELLSSIASDIKPPVAALVSEGIRRGRRRRLHTRMRDAAVVITVLAATVGVGFGVTGVIGRPGSGGSTVGTGQTLTRSGEASAGTLPTSRAQASIDPSSSGFDPRRASMPPANIALTTKDAEQVFVSLLPPGHFTWDPLTAQDLAMFANYTPAGSNRSYQVMFEIKAANPAAPTPAFSQCYKGGTDDGRRPAGALPISCQLSPVTGGGVAAGGIARVDVTPCDTWGFYQIDAAVLRPDGVVVWLSIANGTTTPSRGKPITVSAPRPPVTAEQLLTMAESELWK
jgi:hypothetical protein